MHPFVLTASSVAGLLVKVAVRDLISHFDKENHGKQVILS